MLSSDLKPEQFQTYPPEGRQLAVAHIGLLKQLPPSFEALLLREVIAYDWKFPAEQKDVTQQLAYLGSLSDKQRQEAMAGFAQIRLSRELEGLDWVNAPTQFSERLTAHLWSSHQIDGFRAAALDYGRRVDASRKPEIPPIPRLGIMVIGQGVAVCPSAMFRKLRKQGVYFKAIKPENGVRMIVDAVAARATAHPVPFGHWYIDGATQEPVSSAGLTLVSYHALEPARAAILKKMEKVIKSGTGGPEALHDQMAELRPEEIGLDGTGDVAVLNHFQSSVLAEGSGTQIFSTSFVQWAAREALRRAQPVTLLARFTPRQRQRPMGELIASPQQSPTLDPEGSLIDADMGAYLTWINQQRLTGAEQSSFLVWWEDHPEAVAIAPTLPHGAVSNSPIDLNQVLAQIT
ncbi:MAG: hypothetical protein ACLQVG_03770 [Terriglobia bacterium]